MKTEVVKTLDAITEYLNGLSDSELIQVHNEYCQKNSYEEEIYSNDEDFFNTFFSNDVIKAVQATNYGSYSYTDKYVQFNGQGNLDSFNSAEEGVNISDIARAIYNGNFEPDGIELIEYYPAYKGEFTQFEGGTYEEKQAEIDRLQALLDDMQTDLESINGEEFPAHNRREQFEVKP